METTKGNGRKEIQMSGIDILLQNKNRYEKRYNRSLDKVLDIAAKIADGDTEQCEHMISAIFEMKQRKTELAALEEAIYTIENS